MPQLLRVPVISKNGVQGDLLTTSRLLDDRLEKSVILETGREIQVLSRYLSLRSDGSYFLNLTVDPRPPDGGESTIASGQSLPEPSDQIVVPRIEEQISVSRRTVETGRVRVHKSFAEESVTIDEPTVSEHYEVKHVPIGREVEEAGPTRVEGNVVIVPVYEEETVVTKRLILREELHLTKKTTETHSPQTISLRKEKITVERVQHSVPRPISE